VIGLEGDAVTKQIISTPAAPAPAGPYSQAVRVGGMVAVAGQVGIDPVTGDVAGDDITSQTRQAITNLEAVLGAAGATLADVVRVGVFLTDLVDFAAMNEVYAELVPEPRPARTTVGVALPGGLRIELDALAIIDSER
jgi:reactive intermediate/imine deaminase